jgi:hypothetical protein
MIVSVFFAFMFTTIFYLWKSKYGDMHFSDGIEFGAPCWLTFSLIAEIGNVIYVNYSRMFVFGKCVSSLVEYLVAVLRLQCFCKMQTHKADRLTRFKIHKV